MSDDVGFVEYDIVLTFCPFFCFDHFALGIDYFVSGESCGVSAGAYVKLCYSI